MPDSTVVRVSGLRELGANMARLKRDIAIKHGARAVGKGAQFVKRAAKKNIRARAYDTGNLHDSVIVKRLRQADTDLTVEYIVTVRRTRSRTAKVTQAAAWYGHFLEFGTVKMSARPFLGPSLRDNVDAVVQVIKRSLSDQLNRGRV